MNKQKCLWGVALSAGQCEGAYNEDGKGISIFDTLDQSKERAIKRFPLPNEFEYYPSHVGPDFYHHLEEDLKLMKECHIECFRTSFAWSRIFPTGFEKEPNELGLKFYDRMIDLCHTYHIEPIITLSHLEIPYQLFDKLGGWENKEFIEHFTRYAEVIFNRYQGKVKYWITFNEINTTIHFPLIVGVGIDRSKDALSAQYQATHHIMVANAIAIKKLKEIDPKAVIGAMIAYAPIYPLTSHPLDIMKAHDIERENLFVSDILISGKYPYYTESFFKKEHIHIDVNEEELKLINQYRIDFLAVSYYNTHAATAFEGKEKKVSGNLFGGVENPYLEKTAWGWQIDPYGIRIMLNTLAERYDIPLMIVENGIGAIDKVSDGHVNDDYRISYLQEHIEQVQKAIEDGVSLIAYTMWSFIDIVSASGGQMSKRYGLVYVDRDNEGKGTNQRICKKSYYWFKDFIDSVKEE